MPEVPPSLWGFAILASIPLLAAACTAFTKVSVVLAALRVGLSAEALLPWTAIVSLSVLVTLVIMGPTALAVWDQVQLSGGLDSIVEGGPDAWAIALEPLRGFLERNADPEEIGFFADLYGDPDSPLALVLGFVVTELGEALLIAVVLILPFVLVDLVVAQVLTLIGSASTSSNLYTIPLKILVFLGAGGWDVVIGGLVEGYL